MRCQPIAIIDVVTLLVQAVTDLGCTAGSTRSGADVLTYAEMMAIYAQVAGLSRRHLIRVPVVSPVLSAHWVGLVAPVPAKLARELVESLINEVVVTDTQAAGTSRSVPSGSPSRSRVAWQQPGWGRRRPRSSTPISRTLLRRPPIPSGRAALCCATCALSRPRPVRPRCKRSSRR